MHRRSPVIRAGACWLALSVADLLSADEHYASPFVVIFFAVIFQTKISIRSLGALVMRKLVEKVHTSGRLPQKLFFQKIVLFCDIFGNVLNHPSHGMTLAQQVGPHDPCHFCGAMLQLLAARPRFALLFGVVFSLFCFFPFSRGLSSVLF